MMERSFVKMHGLGNDFVIFDARTDPLELGDEDVRAIADRQTGVGCDQLIILRPAQDPQADVFMEIRNADGAEVGACGNVSRCVGAMITGEKNTTSAVIQTRAGLLHSTKAADGDFSVDMGPARFAWQDIPLARDMNTLHLDVAAGPLSDGVGVNMGNPHAVFFVDDVETVDIKTWGPQLEHDPAFPERANIGVATITKAGHIRLRVWERGAGLTRACGSGACAALVAAARRGYCEREAQLHLDGGTLHIAWREDGHVIMTGPFATSFHGSVDIEALHAQGSPS